MLEKLLRNIVGNNLTKRMRKSHALEDALCQYKLATISEEMGQLDKAEAHYREAIRLDSLSPVLCYNLGLLLHGVGDLSGAEECYRRALEFNPNDQAIHSSLLCIADFSCSLTQCEIFQRHVSWAQKFGDPQTLRAMPATNNPDPHKRLKIGYVSADFRRHVTGRFIEPVLRNHDVDRFDVYCYSNHAIEDDMTAHLRSLVTHWRNIQQLDDERVVEMIRSDGIDVLIDLSGHSSGNRLIVFSRKPAPVQVTWMGYLNTTGLSAMDYRLTDDVADPQEVDCWYRERLLRMSQPQWCYVPDAGPISAQTESVSARPLNAPVTFGCMTRFMKVSDLTVELWIRILCSSPGTRLCVIDVPDHSRGKAFRRRFSEAGLVDRVDFYPTLHGDVYWHMFSNIDVALDPFPYTGATTTCDCLWMGVPVVTLAGKRGVGRSATSLLSAVGLHELIASSEDEYVVIAGTLASNRARIGVLRSELRDRMRQSTICDASGFVRSLEQKLSFGWKEWCGASSTKRSLG